MSKKKYIFIAGGIITALILSFTIIYILPKLQTKLIIIKQSILALKEISGLREDLLTTNVPVSEMGIDYYAQGGIVVDGIAYFTGNWKDRRRGNCYRKSQNFPYVVSFDVKSFKKIKTFNFYDTYDSAPLLVQKKSGTTLIIAHEHLKKRTKAINVMTGNTEWLSKENQPGGYFFGYSYFINNDGTTIIFGGFRNGLHAISAENGKNLWTFSVKSTGGVTPCVDQKSGFVYYQFDGGIVKLNINTGKVVKKADVSHPNRCISWNTVLIDDEYGYYIATYWYGRPTWDSAIRVYDKNLTLLWERKSLPSGKKATLTYTKGKIITGTGNGWSERYFGNKWKFIKAYSVKSGQVIWECDLSGYGFRAIYNVPYFNGYLYAETQDIYGFTSKLFRIKAIDGTIESYLDYGRPITSCAPSIIAYGKMFSGDGLQDKIVVTRLCEKSDANWEGPFGCPQKNHNALPDGENVKIVPMEEIIID